MIKLKDILNEASFPKSADFTGDFKLKSNIDKTWSSVDDMRNDVLAFITQITKEDDSNFKDFVKTLGSMNKWLVDWDDRVIKGNIERNKGEIERRAKAALSGGSVFD